MGENGEDQIEIPIAWVGADEVPIEFANQIIVQHQGDEFVVTVGQMVGPAIVGEVSPEDIAKIDYIPVRVLARLGITEQRLREFVQVMQANLDNYDEAKRRMDPRGESG